MSVTEHLLFQTEKKHSTMAGLSAVTQSTLLENGDYNRAYDSIQTLLEQNTEMAGFSLITQSTVKKNGEFNRGRKNKLTGMMKKTKIMYLDGEK